MAFGFADWEKGLFGENFAESTWHASSADILDKREVERMKIFSVFREKKVLGYSIGIGILLCVVLLLLFIISR